MRLNDENSIGPDPEMILARHESQNYIPHNYPNWDEKMWAKYGEVTKGGSKEEK